MIKIDLLFKRFFKPVLASVSCFLILAHMPIALANSGVDPKISWKVAGTVGLLDDSNVGVDELDQLSTQGDSAITLSAKAGAKIQLAERVELRASVSLSDKSFNDFDQFDLTTSLFSLQSSYDFLKFKFGGGMRYISTDLASNSFLSNQQLYAFATHRLNKRWFFRGELNFADKEFDLESSRDTSREKIGIDAYYFLDGTKRLWSYGLQFADEQSESNNDQFSRDITTVKVKYSQLTNVFARDVRLEAQVRYQTRDYGAVDSRIGEVREDDRVRAKISAEVPIADKWFILGEYEYSDYSSNLPSADYSQNLFSIKVGWSLD